jgi:photosystem II stability/assembly factor-like uncharacterized protein
MKIYSLSFLVLILFSFVAASLPGKRHEQKSGRPAAANILFKSTDGGQTWQDISAGLPGDSLRDGFNVTDNGLYLRAGNSRYHINPNSTTTTWVKEIFPHKYNSIAPGKRGIYAYYGRIFQRINGTSEWLPVFTNFPQTHIRTIFETAGGIVFIGCQKGLYKSTDNGKNWKQVRAGHWWPKIVESNGVLMAASLQGIIRSTDGGENWDNVINEGGVAMALERIDGGFAAITFNTQSETRRVRTSYDDGKTWQAIDASLPASPNIASIVQVGEYLLCGHPRGIMRSSDKGKTWELLLPSIGNKVFNLSVSGGVIYAIPTSGGC